LNLKVLIVDDNGTNRRLLETLLTSWRVNYRSASSGAAALLLLEEQTFELVLLDVQMPEMDGFEVAAAIRQRWPASDIKIALLTSIGSRGDAAHCRELEIDAHLSKPLKNSDLLQAIRMLFLARPEGRSKDSRDVITGHSLRGNKNPPALSQPLRILVAEDNVVNQTLARRLLEKRGHNVTMAADGREAIQAFEQYAFDLILMDIQMPEMDGFQATQAIRQRESNHHRTPIIALTAHALVGDRERCLAAGMDGFISKPIDLSELLDAISALCGEPVPSKILTPL
jgi:CheY-like chemotaxis protein